MLLFIAKKSILPNIDCKSANYILVELIKLIKLIKKRGDASTSKNFLFELNFNKMVIESKQIN